jgi:hypothetical protein
MSHDYLIARLREQKSVHSSYSGTGRVVLVRGDATDPLCRQAADTIAALVAERDAAVAGALPIVREYARKNPLHHFGECWQDPNGAHMWLEKYDAARQPTALITER